MPHRRIDPSALGEQKSINATAEGKLWTNWKTAVGVAVVAFCLGSYVNGKTSEISAVQAGAVLLDARMAKIEVRVANIETVVNAMDNKFLRVEQKLDAISLRVGASPLVNSGK